MWGGAGENQQQSTTTSIKQKAQTIDEETLTFYINIYIYVCSINPRHK